MVTEGTILSGCEILCLADAKDYVTCPLPPEEQKACKMRLQYQAGKEQEAVNIISCVKDAKRVHPDWAIDDVIELLNFREETRQAIKRQKGGMQ